MVGTPRVTMTMRELDRLKCVQGVVDRQLKLYQAAERLGLTTRQVRRLVRRYRQEGPVGLISRHRNRPSNNRLKDAVADQAFRIIRAQYADFGPTLAAEKLRERHGVDLAVETVPLVDGCGRAVAAAQAATAEDSAAENATRMSG